MTVPAPQFTLCRPPNSDSAIIGAHWRPLWACSRLLKKLAIMLRLERFFITAGSRVKFYSRTHRGGIQSLLGSFGSADWKRLTRTATIVAFTFMVRPRKSIPDGPPATVVFG